MPNTVEDRIKAWLTPGLITCFGMISWGTINEIRSDVKALLESNAQVKVEIQNLKERIGGVEAIVYSQRLFTKPDEIEVPKPRKK